jgi:hypothetical protein
MFKEIWVAMIKEENEDDVDELSAYDHVLNGHAS